MKKFYFSYSLYFENLYHMMVENFSNTDYQRVEDFFNQYPQATVQIYPIDDLNLVQYGIPFWHGTQVANSRLFFQEIMKSMIILILELCTSI